MNNHTTDKSLVSTVALPLGSALLVAGTLDTALLWWPLRVGNVEWEFATISATFNSLPLATIGMGLLSAGAIARNSRWLSRLVSAVAMAFCLALVVAALLYLLTLPVAWRGTAPQAREILLKLITKTAVYGPLYIALFAWFARLILRNMPPRTARAVRSGKVVTPLEGFNPPASQPMEPSSSR